MLRNHNLFLFLFFLTSFAFGQQTYLDTFSSVSYSNNNGTNNFSSNWIEGRDDNSPSGGRIRVVGNRLRFQDLDDRFIHRQAPLAGASSATFTMDYDATNRGDERLLVYIWNPGAGTFNLIANLNTSNTGSVSYNLTAAEIASNPRVLFYRGDTDWGGSERIFVDNVQFSATFSPVITVDNVTVNEAAGTATFTVTHTGASASGSFTVNYTTQDGTATVGSDYTLTTGTLNFNGTSGDTEQITVPILNNPGFEATETFTIQFTGSSDASVDISDTGTGTIIDPSNNPRPYEERRAINIQGNFKMRGNTNIECVSGCPATPDTNNPSAVMGYANYDGDASTVNSSSSTITLPAGATVTYAGLYWGGLNSSSRSGITNPPGSLIMDQVKMRLPGSPTYNTVNATIRNRETTSQTPWETFLAYADVTSLVQTGGSGEYFVADIALATGSAFTGPFGGWTMVVIYEDPSEKSRNISVWDGFDFFGFGANDAFTVTGLLTPATGAFESHAGYFAFDGEGYATGDYVSINGTALSNGANPADNALNGTISEFGVDVGGRNPNYAYSWGMDIDVFDSAGLVPNAATSLNVDLGSSSEGVWGGVFVTSNEIAFPAVAEKIFTPSVIEPSDESTVSITVDNPSNGVSLTNFSLTDSFPTGMMISTTPNASSSCGGTVTAVTGSNSFSVTGVNLPAGTSCTFTFDVETSGEGVFTNTLSPSDITNDQNIPLQGVASGTLTVQDLTDSDNDGVRDTVDRDDDNDGILDVVEANNCAPTDPTVDVTIFSETFGSANGNRVSTPYTNYPFEDGTGSAGGSPNLQDGEYTIFEDIESTATWAPTVWQSVGDHTTGSDRMMIINANNTAGLEFYRRTLTQVVENVPLDISFWVMNLDVDSPSNSGRTEPDITATIMQGGTTVFSFNTGAVPREADGNPAAWKQFTGSFTPASDLALELVLVNNASGGSGNDLALDDIEVIQSFCDSDGDGQPNTLQVDSDGDGCNDSDEAYTDVDADSDDNGKYGSGNPAVNADGTVTAASYQTPADLDGNGTYDFQEAGSAPTITTQPQDQEIENGSNATFSVTATGNALSYQWQESTDGGVTYSDISGETNTTLTITGASLTQNWNLYRVVISDASYVCSDTTSNAAQLRVAPDSDGDGVLDTTDLDDDNDGILDTLECPNTILWVTDGTAAPEEQRTIDKLTALGYIVTVVDDGVGGNADNYAVTFIYEDANSGTAFANVANMATTTKGVLTSETFLHDELLGANQGATTVTNILNITNNTHPVTAGLALGNYDIGDASFRANSLVSGTHLGFHPNGEVSLAVWETGDALDVGTAPGRRAIVPHSNSNGGFNAAGENLLINAILWTAAIDTDRDGVNDHLDLDSDNDGIYDAVEAGHSRPHTSGIVNGTYGANGLANIVETSAESGTLNYSIRNTDSTTSPDYQDTDSDDDGCSDANEAYADDNADTGDNEYYGTGSPPAIDGEGRVTAATYPVPADGDSNSTQDYREAGSAPVITTQPTDETACPGANTSFSVTASNSDTYQWQLFSGGVWTDLSDSGIHSGTATATLSITNAQTSDNGNQYRVIVSNSSYICSTETSNQVTLTVAEPTVNAGADQEICDGESVTLTATTSGGTPGYTYLWNTGQTTPSITFTPTGDPTVNININYTVTVTDTNGCQDTDTVRVSIESAPTVMVSTSTTSCGLDNGGITFTFSDHPNRTGIEFSLDNQATYEVNVNDNSGSVTYSGLAAGTYRLWARWGNNECPVDLGNHTIGTIPQASFDTQPTDQTVFVNSDGTFMVNASNADTYQWQVSTNGGASYGNIVDSAEYIGTQTDNLTVNQVEVDKNNYRYRVQVSSTTTSCAVIVSNPAILMVRVRTVITNRRITHRVKKN